MQFHLATIGTLKRRSDFAFKRQAATLAERWPDETNLLPATRADKSFTGRCAFIAANLTGFGINKRERGFEPGLDGRARRGHVQFPRFRVTGRQMKISAARHGCMARKSVV